MDSSTRATSPEEVARGLKIVPADATVVGTDSCFYHQHVVQVKRGGVNEVVELFLTDRRAISLGSKLTATPWAKVARIGVASGGLSIQRYDRESPYIFKFVAASEFIRAKLIADALLERSTPPANSAVEGARG